MNLRNRTQHPWIKIASLVCVANLVLQPIAGAATLYWDGSTGNSWATVANWSTVIGGGTDPVAVPGASDDVVLNANSVGTKIATLGGVQSAQSLTFSANSTSAITLANNTLTLGAGGITLSTGAAAHTISSAITLGAAQTWANNAANTFTVSGLISGGTANSLTINSSSGCLIVLSSSASSYMGSTTLASGTLTIGANSTATTTWTATTARALGIVTVPTAPNGYYYEVTTAGTSSSTEPTWSTTLGASVADGTITYTVRANPTGPIGTGALILNGGILTANGTYTIGGNSITVGGSATLDSNNGGTSVTFTMGGPVTLNNGAVLGYTNSGASNTAGSKIVFTGLVTLGANPTVNLNATYGTAQFGQWNGGIDLNNGNRTVSVNGTGTLALGLAGTLKDTGGSGHALTFNGTKNVTVTAVISAGTGNPGLIYSGTGTMDLGAQASTWTGGYTQNSGTTAFSSGSTLTGGNQVLNSNFGTGTITLNGGLLAENSTSQTINNSLILGGTVTIASIVNPGNTLTFNPTAITVPSAGTITVNGPVTLMTNHGGATGLTLNGPITGINSPSLTIKNSIYGIGTVYLVNASGTASTFGNVTIGDSSTSGSLGGNLSVSSQNALGSGTVTIYAGGTLTQASSFNINNAITVNPGGRLSLNGTPATLITFGSGAVLATGGTVTLAQGTTASFPTAGVFFNNAGNAVTVSTAYPAFTGTLAFGGTGGSTLTTGAATTTSGAQTLAFNQNGGGSVTLNGLTLGGNLTIAGTGNTGLAGTTPVSPAGILGTVTESGSRSITVNMAPIGVVQVNPSAAGWSGGTVVSGGILAVNGGNNNQKMLGSAGVTLNGGTIRNLCNANNDSTWQDIIAVTANGGTIESFSIGNLQWAKFTGGISGSSSLTLRYGGTSGNGSGVLLYPASPSSYSGTIALATSTGNGAVLFNANSLNSVPASGVTVPGGVAFGVDALGTLTGNIGKFATTADSILVLDNLAASNIDLSVTGINRDIRIGGSSYRNAFTYTGTLTPFGSTYNVTPTDNLNLTFGTANQFTGNRNLDVRAGAVFAGAQYAAYGTLAITAAQDYSGTTLVAGTIKNCLMGAGGMQGTTLTTSANLVNTSGITVDKGATFTLTGGTSGAANVPILVTGGGTLNVNVNSALTASGTLTLGGTNGGGTYASANTQSLGSLTVAAGSSARSGAGVLTLTNAAATVYARNTGGVVNFSAVNTSFNSAPTGTGVSQGLDGDAILVGAFSNSVDFVKAAAGAIAGPAYTTQNALANWGTAGSRGNILVNGAVSGSVPSGSINSLNVISGQTIAIGSGNTLTIGSGMIINSNVATTVSGGTGVTGGANELIVNAYSGNTLTLSSAIVQNSGNNIALTKLGAGTLTLSYNGAEAISDVYALGGTIQGNYATSLPTSGTHTFYLLGGNLNPGVTTSFGSGISLIVGPQGGQLNHNAGQTVTFGGPVTLNGTLAWNVGSGGSGTTTIFNGNLNGGGMIGWGKPPNLKNYLVFTGDNANWSGGLRQDTAFGNSAGGTMHVRFAPSSSGYKSAGSGPILFNNGPSGDAVYFDTTAAGSTTFSNDIVNIVSAVPLVAWGLSTGLGTSGTPNTTTLSGRILGNQGLYLQGYATNDNAISEMVLSGTLGMNGSSAGYSYGTSSLAQNFNNGQAGITLGVTALQGTTAVLTTSSDPRLDSPSTVNGLCNGAEGFVRFAPDATTGRLNSFIPGAVGPGYVAAIRKAGTGNDTHFGYLLTATATPTTYAIPEGKSFVIGSLGSGTQVGGVLGAAGAGTANLDGGNKYATGQLLAGFNGGDINIHANAAINTQSLTLLARDASTLLVLGNSSQVVVAPTYGDSGASGAITLMAARTGTGAATVLNKLGAGTVEIKNVAFTTPGTNTDARSQFTWNVNAGTLKYSQVDTGTNYYAGVNVNSGGTLSGTGTLNSAVSVASGGKLAAGTGLGSGTLTVNSNVTLTAGAVFEVGVSNSVCGKLTVSNGVLTLGGTLTVAVAPGASAGNKYSIISATGSGSVTGTFSNRTVQVGSQTLPIVYEGNSIRLAPPSGLVIMVD